MGLTPKGIEAAIKACRTETVLNDGATERAGVAPFQTRDIRRTWKSRMGDGAGVDRFTRDLLQQHAQAGDTGSTHYDHADYLPQMRAAMERWAAWLGTAGIGKTLISERERVDA